MCMTKDGKRLFISMNMAGRIVMFDTSNAEKPRVLDVLDLVANSGPHYIALTSDESRLVTRPGTKAHSTPACISGLRKWTRKLPA